MIGVHWVDDSILIEVPEITTLLNASVSEDETQKQACECWIRVAVSAYQ